MTIYQVYDWDDYASNHGDEYLAATYSTKDAAEAKARALNAAARAHFMASCSPGAEQNYRDRAHVRAVDVID